MSLQAAVESKLLSELHAEHCTVEDESGDGGCGDKLRIALLVSPDFQGKSRLARQRAVYSVLSEEMEHIHALSFGKCLTPEEHAAT